MVNVGVEFIFRGFYTNDKKLNCGYIYLLCYT